MESAKELQEKIRDAQGLIKGHKNRIRVVKTTMTNEQFYKKSVELHKARIAQHQKELEDLEYTREHGPEIIAESSKRIREIQREIVLLGNKREITRLLELAKQMEKLFEEVGKRPCPYVQGLFCPNEIEIYSDGECDDCESRRAVLRQRGVQV